MTLSSTLKAGVCAEIGGGSEAEESSEDKGGGLKVLNLVFVVDVVEGFFGLFAMREGGSFRVLFSFFETGFVEIEGCRLPCFIAFVVTVVVVVVFFVVVVRGSSFNGSGMYVLVFSLFRSVGRAFIKPSGTRYSTPSS